MPVSAHGRTLGAPRQAPHGATAEDADLSETLLRVLSRHPDAVTAEFSRWALDFRFAPDGSIRPLLAAAGRERTT